MNRNLKDIAKKFSYSFSANMISTLISVLLVSIVPKALGVEQYGYWQLYVFYTSYVGFFHFGWADGIYLRYGGQEYAKLDQKMLNSQFWLLAIFEIGVAACISVFAWFSADGPDKTIILFLTACCCVIHLPRTLLEFVLQMSNRIERYAKIVLIERTVYCVTVLLLLQFGVRSYGLLLAADLTAKILGLILVCVACKEIVWRKMVFSMVVVQEAWTNVRVGIKLMFANVASMLIIGIVRFSIEQTWDIATFGKVSFTLSICNLMMLFINAVSVVIFPILKRTPEERLPQIYTLLRGLLIFPMAGLLVLYYPAKVILSLWLPQYADSLHYMALLFPICLYEGKMAMLVNTYLKAMRKEKTILLVNACAVAISFITTLVTVVWLKSITLAVLAILVLLAFRCVFAEILLSKCIHISIWRQTLLELLLTVLFVAVSWIVGGWPAMVIYLAGYAVFLALQRREVMEIVHTLLKQFHE